MKKEKTNNKFKTPPMCEQDGANIELRSDEVQEILSRPPHALVQYGISVITIVIIILFIGSFFFRYPDIITGEIIITTEKPPVWLIAKTTGRLRDLKIRDAQHVKQGTILAVIDNTASTNDILLLNNLLKDIVINETYCSIPETLLKSTFELGIVQNSFSVFLRAVVNYTNFLNLNISNHDKTSLYQQIEHKKTYNKALIKQLELKKKDLQLSKKAFERDKILFAEKLISAYNLELAEQTYLNKQLDLQQFEATISISNVEAYQMTASVNKLFTQNKQEHIQLLSELQSAQRELNSTLENWMQTYALIAPLSGKIAFNTIWQSDQNINTGDKVFAIIPEIHGNYIGVVQITNTGAGKVKSGQKVNVKVAGYPYMEFGYIKGKTKSISLMANNSLYTVHIVFPEGLKTTVNKQLKFDGELSGTAEIITENRSLVERIYTPVKLILNKSFDE